MADFTVTDDGDRISMSIRARDGRMSVHLRAQESEAWPARSCFESLAESSAFFAGGSVGYSVTRDCCRLDGIRLQTERWEVRPLSVEHVESTFFADDAVFPSGSVTFDHALIMRDLHHQWHGEPALFIDQTSARATANQPEAST